jgi:molybdate transport system substrate-binding protein
VSAEDKLIIAHVGLGLGNRTGSPASDISTAEKSRITLLGVDLIVFNRVA